MKHISFYLDQERERLNLDKDFKDKDGVKHHASNKHNCSICMNVWIAQENARVLKNNKQNNNNN